MRKMLSFVAIAAVCAMVLTFTSSLRAADDAKKTEAKGTIKVTVTDEAGKPVEGAEVTATAYQPRRARGAAQQQAAAPGDATDKPADKTPPDTNTPRRRATPVSKATTDAKGVATLTEVPVGEFNIGARKADIGTARKRVTVKEGTNPEVALTLKKQAPRRAPAAGQ
jgi:hypothetical protein